MPKGKPIIDIEKCKGCALCVTACPQKIINMANETNAQGVNFAYCIDESRCIACMSCATICPDMVIEILKFD